MQHVIRAGHPSIRSIASHLALFVALLPEAGAAQTDGDRPAGLWTVEWAQAIRVNADGSVQIQRWGEADLILRREGDRISGEWIVDVRERVVWRVEGTWRDGRLDLRATEHDSDDPELSVVESMEWHASVEGERMEGTVRMNFRGARTGRASPPRPFRASWRGPAPG